VGDGRGHFLNRLELVRQFVAEEVCEDVLNTVVSLNTGRVEADLKVECFGVSHASVAVVRDIERDCLRVWVQRGAGRRDVGQRVLLRDVRAGVVDRKARSKSFADVNSHLVIVTRSDRDLNILILVNRVGCLLSEVNATSHTHRLDTGRVGRERCRSGAPTAVVNSVTDTASLRKAGSVVSDIDGNGSLGIRASGSRHRDDISARIVASTTINRAIISDGCGDILHNCAR